MIKQLRFVLLVLILGFVGIVAFTKLYPEFLWYDSFRYAAVWLFRIKSEFITWGVFTSIAFIWLSLQVSIANKNSASASKSSDYHVDTPFEFLNRTIDQLKQTLDQSQQTDSFSKKAYGLMLTLVTFGLSILFGLAAKSWWEDLYLYLNQQPYGMADPVFGQDVSFYLFSLPLFNHIQNWFVSLFVVSLIMVGWIYFSRNILLVIFSKNREFSGIKRHLISLLAITFILFSAGTWLGIYDVVYSSQGVVFGAAYTDVTIILPVKKLISILFVIEAVLVLFLISRPTFKLPYLVLGLIFLLNFIGLRVVPNIVQNYIVSPNELVKEKPYIESNIKFTREAYGLNNIQEVQFPATHDLAFRDIMMNNTTVENIRLWNQEPLKQTFSQLQEIRLYYEFSQVDVDRYMINDKPQQVMLSVRELDSSILTAQAQTWTNRHLIYTHGYGLCMTPVNEVTTDGLPEFFIKDIPPKSSINVGIENPAVYFGEMTTDYVIVNTKQNEFDYPKGDSNVYTNYAGKGGIVLNSLFRRFLYAIKFSDFKLLFTSLLKPDSRLMYDRSIQQIPKKIAPFLIFDHDPYIVISDSGRLVWVYDAYTASSKFPYSEPFMSRGRVNYIRNAVKVTIDAYDGTTNFYIMDQYDPIIQAYDKVYAGLFQPFSAMPLDIQRHIRYPKDLFTVQAMVLNTYHMTDPQVFYNKEDLWEFPQETYEGSEKTMSPYYLVTKLPGDEKESFILMLPFTPANKNNMIAWLAAKCDRDEYGEFRVLKLPKERTIYGPMQIESRIDQHTEISKDLTLWGQMGSKVIRGNLMIIPIKQSLLYVEPIYLQATQSKLPELKRVVVSYEDKIVMAKNLGDAIFELFGLDSDMLEESQFTLDESNPAIKKDSINQVIDVFTALKKSLQGAQWSSFGIHMEELERSIERLKQQRP